MPLRAKHTAPQPSGPTSLLPNSIFNEARLKAFRGRRHIHELSTVFQGQIEQHQFIQRNSVTGEYGLWVTFFPHPLIGLALGDALHCLRSCFDYLVSSMASSANIKDSNIVFPFNANREEVRKSYNNSGQRKRERAFSELVAAYPQLPSLIDEIEPWLHDDPSDSHGDLIYRLITMDNVDKHRLITPTVQATSIDTARAGLGVIANSHVEGAMPLVSYGRQPPPLGFSVEVDADVDLAFADGGVLREARLAGRSVIESLLRGATVAEWVTAKFEATFGNQAAVPFPNG